ncbi:PHD finger domain-containing protein [Coniochaeta hoffmannii]|uniref:PHD finger domain-containing protein n=1 Tax=Coniochaeta hoffmannii TaxID=91930 RepID=A0AA38RW94_9PEZI|nr:PHD finger domain-containing protein [Coniochaeta hoffmannii]
MGSAALAAADLDEAISPRQTNSTLDKAIHNSPTATRAANSALGPISMRADPDAQATVTDFLDFTEYLPSDMTRSLTLIGKLDQTYVDASVNLHDLTTKWAQLPNLPPEERPVPAQLRAEVSENLSSAVSSRVYSHAEATRMADNVAKHYNRAKSILTKLKTMLDNWPPPEEQKSPVATRSPQVTRAPKITVRVGGQRVRRQQVPRITVPGEVLAPYELNYEAYESDSESSSEEADEPVPRPPSRATATPAPQPRIRIVKNPKQPKTPKTPKVRNSVLVASDALSGPRPRELSTSKILAKLQPPPDNVVPGTADAPWLQLTTYELARLRKRMKKNAAWAPSDTMIARELKLLGRGVESYRAAKQKAEEEGRPFEDGVPAPVVDDETGATVMPPGALSVEAMAAEDKTLSNRGMKLNEAKRSKRENDLARLAAEEAEASARKMLEAAKAMFTPSQPPSLPDQSSQAKPDRKARQKKRKRDSVAGTDVEEADGLEMQAQRPQVKRTKTETPVPHPQLGAQPSQEATVQPQHLAPGGAPVVTRTTPVPVPVPGQDQSAKAQSGTSPATTSNAPHTGAANNTTKTPTETPIPPPVPSERKSSTPILPPVRETRKSQAARLQEQQQASATAAAATPKPPSRGATPAARHASPAVDVADAPSAPPATTSGPVTRRPASRGKAASQEPQSSLASDRPRRASTARNTPAPPETLPARPASRRQSKRPAPGVISRTNSGGNSAVGRRKAAPKKKSAAASRAGAKKDKVSGGAAGGGDGAGPEVQDVEYDDDGKVVDPDEPRYCLCNRVSFGTMIQCDNDNCKLEWFHLECVGLSDVPARTTKWYCPDCRVLLNIGQKGEVNARGVRT